MIAGFVGAVVLTGLSLASAKAWMAGLLLFFGAMILARFGFGVSLLPRPRRGHTVRWLGPIGALGGFVDATGGGGWGPVVTPSLLTVTAHEPRKIVGTVSASEFLVALSVSTGFITGAAHHDIPWMAVLGLVLSGVIVAPLAARLAGRLPHHLMGTLVGGLILLTNGIVVVQALGGVPTWAAWTLANAALLLTLTAAAHAWRRDRRASHPPTAVAATSTPKQS